MDEDVPSLDHSFDYDPASYNPVPLDRTPYQGRARVAESLAQDIKVANGKIDALTRLVEKLADTSARNPNHAPWIHEGAVGYHTLPVLAPGSPALARVQREYPAVTIWLEDDAADDAVAPTELPPKPAGKKLMAQGINTTARHLQHEDGTVIDGFEHARIGEYLRELLVDIRAAGLLAARVDELGHHAKCALVYMLERRFPYLRLCPDHWKVLSVIKARYRHWAGYRDEDKGTKRKATENAGTAPKRRRTENPAKNKSLLVLEDISNKPDSALERAISAPPNPMSEQQQPPPEPPLVDEQQEPLPPPESGPRQVPPTARTSAVPRRSALSGVRVPPPAPPPTPPASSEPPAPPATSESEPTASKDQALPNPKWTSARNLAVAVYAADVGGSKTAFSEYWTELAAAAPSRYKAYEDYEKELKKAHIKQLPALDVVRAAIERLDNV
ncbi:hypothetical protein MKEN_01168200 [Mycena kentingensis (nom. inval.)]|nr:hypothetical protein MKEN_01168200 [Mycena kentingensis (nom. inval.)]